jgi:hypothetical protein
MKPLLTLGILLTLPAFLWADVKVESVRLTYGPLGPTRPSIKVLPGETLNVEFVVSGVSTDKDGRTQVTLAAELVDEAGQILAAVPPTPVHSTLALGGATLANQITFSLPDDFPAGKSRVRGILSDPQAKKIVHCEQPVEVMPQELGMVGLRLANDAEGKSPAGGNLTVNQSLFIVGKAIGFTRKENRIHVVGAMRIFDSAGKEMTPHPIAVAIEQEVSEDIRAADFNWSLIANRPGQFKVRLELTDQIANRTVTYELPLVVHTPPELKAN